MSSTLPYGDWPPASVVQKIDSICDRFEAEWQARIGPRAEDYLAQIAERARPELLRQLLRVELYYRRTEPECPTPEEYEQRFPQHSHHSPSLRRGECPWIGRDVISIGSSESSL